MRKAERVIKAAEATDPPWDHTLEGTKLTLRRGDESMYIVWDEKGGLVHPLTYALAGIKEVRLRNVAEALRIIGSRPNYQTRRRVASTGGTTPAAPKSRQPLPFNIEEDSDTTILKALFGRKVVWLNGRTGEYESARVPDRKRVEVPDGPNKTKFVRRASRNVYIKETSEGRRVLTFPAVGEQFRSCGLDQIVQVV